MRARTNRCVPRTTKFNVADRLQLLEMKLADITKRRAEFAAIPDRTNHQRIRFNVLGVQIRDIESELANLRRFK